MRANLTGWLLPVPSADMLRTALLAAARSPVVRSAVERSAVTRPVVERFIAGTTVGEVVEVARSITADRLVTIDYLGEDVTDRARVDATVRAYSILLRQLRAEGLASKADVSVKLSALGSRLPGDGAKIAYEAAHQICQAAAAAGTTVTVDMEDHTTTDLVLGTVRELRRDFPWVGAVVQAQLRRTETDCYDLAGPGSRVRLCKGAYDAPAGVAFRSRHEVDQSFARCLRILMAGRGVPMVATHDPRLTELARQLGARRDGDYELQMLYGVRPAAQTALAAAGERVRVYLPYGTEWYGYFMRRLAERPANVTFFLRALATRS